MTVNVYRPEYCDAGGPKHYLTFIVPAKNGCNLKCPFCIIKQRREALENSLAPDDYATFIRGVARTRPVQGICIQGYEPLLPEAVPYTLAILREASALCIPTSVVTNGTCLADAASALAEVRPRRVGVSLDAATGDLHDRIRGMAGSWAEATAGIVRAKEVLGDSTEVDVISVVQRRNAHNLLGMHATLRELNVSNWILNPLLKVRTDESEAFVTNAMALCQDLEGLVDSVKGSSIRVLIDDEFGLLLRTESGSLLDRIKKLPMQTLSPAATVSRLLPSGHCSMASGTSPRLLRSAAKWTPTVDAGTFLEQLLQPTFSMEEAA